MRIALHHEKPTAYQIMLNTRRFDQKKIYTKQMERVSHWYAKLHERSRHYVPRRQYIHYADRFSKSKR